MENLRRLGENSGPILTHMWTKVHEISDDDCMRPLEARTFQRVARLSVSRFAQQIFAIKSRSRRNRTNWPPIVLGGRPRLLYGILLLRFTVHSWAKPGNELECKI